MKTVRQITSNAYIKQVAKFGLYLLCILIGCEMIFVGIVAFLLAARTSNWYFLVIYIYTGLVFIGRFKKVPVYRGNVMKLSPYKIFLRIFFNIIVLIGLFLVLKLLLYDSYLSVKDYVYPKELSYFQWIFYNIATYPYAWIDTVVWIINAVALMSIGILTLWKTWICVKTLVRRRKKTIPPPFNISE